MQSLQVKAASTRLLLAIQVRSGAIFLPMAVACRGFHPCLRGIGIAFRPYAAKVKEVRKCETA